LTNIELTERLKKSCFNHSLKKIMWTILPAGSGHSVVARDIKEFHKLPLILD